MDTDILHQAISDALAASLAPYVAKLETRLAAVEDRVAANVPRWPITESVKKRPGPFSLLSAAGAPAVAARVLDDSGRVHGEWDHFYSRERRAFQEVWLVCRPCHLRISDRVPFAPLFEAYQQRAELVEGGQMGLFA